MLVDVAVLVAVLSVTVVCAEALLEELDLDFFLCLLLELDLETEETLVLELADELVDVEDPALRAKLNTMIAIMAQSPKIHGKGCLLNQAKYGFSLSYLPVSGFLLLVD